MKVECPPKIHPVEMLDWDLIQRGTFGEARLCEFVKFGKGILLLEEVAMAKEWRVELIAVPI